MAAIGERAAKNIDVRILLQLSSPRSRALTRSMKARPALIARGRGEKKRMGESDMSIGRLLLLAVVAIALYLAFWPAPIDPVAWTPKEDPGMESGLYAPTATMDDAKLIELGGPDGPEDFAPGPDGAIYTAAHGGEIIRYDPASGEVKIVARTDGRPLGIDFGPDGVLYIADAYLGLYALDLFSAGADKKAKLLTNEAAGLPILYADDLAVAGRKIYFSDASTKFGAKASGGTLAGSILEILEHRKTGRVLEYDLDSGETTVLATELSFPNGVEISPDGSHIVVAETGEYRLVKIGLEGADRGKISVLIDGMPGFPDNVEIGPDGLYWVGVTSPRIPLMDNLAGWPGLRKVVTRLPAIFRPGPLKYGMVVAIDEAGAVRASVQDATGRIWTTATALRTEDALYISRLSGPNFAKISPPPASR